VGRSGSGKSTLVRLVPRLYEPNAGAVLLDGRPLPDYKLADLRRQIALVSQHVVLFDDTVANNVAYGELQHATEAEVIAALEAANAMEFVRRLPRGSPRASATPARCSRAGSGSASRSRARSSRTRPS
jgi:subfamily B ATP-binding cassette protein MsbA